MHYYLRIREDSCQHFSRQIPTRRNYFRPGVKALHHVIFLYPKGGTEKVDYDQTLSPRGI